MNFADILLISLGVSVDAFSVSVSGSFCDRTGKVLRNAFRAALYFGGFQFFMPFIGFTAADLFAGFVSGTGHWIAFALLLFVGAKMLCDGWKKYKKDEPAECAVYDFFSWKALILPAVATSIDAFAIGAGLAFADERPLFPCISMGVVTGIIAFAGVYAGRNLALWGKRVFPEWSMLMAGGTAIVLVGGRILWTGLTAV